MDDNKDVEEMLYTDTELSQKEWKFLLLYRKMSDSDKNKVKQLLLKAQARNKLIH